MLRTLLLSCVLGGSCLAAPLQLQPQESSPAVAPAAAEANPKQQEELTPSALAALTKELESAEIDEDLRKKVQENYKLASDELARATKLRDDTRADTQRAEVAETESEDVQLQIGITSTEPPPGFAADFDLERLKTEVLARTPQLEALQSKLERLQTAERNIDERRKELANAQATLPTRKDDTTKQLEQAPPEGENPLLSNARRTLAQAKLIAIEAEGPAISAELARIGRESAVQLPRRQIELTKKQIALMEAEIALLKRRQNEARKDETQKNAENLKLIPEGTPEREQADEWFQTDYKLASQLIPAAVKLAAQRKQERTDDETTEKNLRDRVERLGVVVSVGMQLQEQLAELRDIRQIERDIVAREAELAKLASDRLVHEEELAAIEAKLEKDPDNSATLQRQASILRTLIRNETTYADELRNVDLQERLLVKGQRRFEGWLRELVLWIRSNKVLGVSDLAGSGRSLAWLASPANWRTVSAALADDFHAHMPLWVAAAVLALVLLVVRQKCRAELVVCGKAAARVSCVDFGPTLRAAWLTVLLSAAWPLVIGFVGFRLIEPPQGSAFSQAVGRGLQTVALMFVVLNLLRQVCRNDGLGEAHFSWSDKSVKKSRRAIRESMILLLPLLFIGATAHAARSAAASASLERICFMAGSLVWAYFSYVVLHPRRGVFSEAIAQEPPGWGARTSWLWYPACILVPITLAVLAAIGYFFTARELSWRLAGMAGLITSLVILQAFLVRWHRVNQRALRIGQAKKRQQAMLKGDNEAGAIVEVEARDLDDVGAQTRRLINTGLLLTALVATWFIWSQVFPAVTFLNKVELWKASRQVSVERIIDGRSQLFAETVLEPVTLLSILYAGFLAIVTITAARNLPGLLEIVLLKRLPLEPALRYAIRTVTRYLVVVVGVTLILSAIGLGWAKVQWLVAGLTVGLGFGLQEIFANFVSGLIILFERPVRLGDVVTIDNVSGTVSRIQIRATTITDWDRKEYIVPNKELVTGRVLNWTLSDKTSRIVIDVGVAYGSDTAKARELLLATANNHPLVLNDPAPMATFEQFGDSTLNLKLRCFLPNLDNRLQTVSELHAAIDAAFSDAGIEIAFPQLDVNLQGPAGADASVG